MAVRLDRELGKLAVARGFATHAQMEECYQALRESPTPANLAQVMIKRGLVNQKQVESLLKLHSSPKEASSVTPLARLGAGMKFGPYEILCELGRGGMGAVYKARDTRLDRVVALKILSDRYVASDEDVHRFQRESKLAARLRHPNLVQIFEAGIVEGVPFFTMEYVEGQTLDQLLADEFTLGARPEWMPRLTRVDKVRIMIKVAEAMHVVHRAGIIHRDLKPGNIIVDPYVEPHVTDFGLAREIRSNTMLTSTGTAMGTPYYMPPEQARGDVHELDSRADVYALGAMLYHALTLRLPFMEATAAVVLRKVIDEDPPAPRKIDPSIHPVLERIVLKAMAKNRDERYLTAFDFARDLERFLAGKPVAARAPGAVTRMKRLIRRYPTASAVVGVALAFLVAFAAYLFFRPGRFTFETVPADAETYVDGALVGRTPLNIKLKRGVHDVRVHRPGFREMRFVVDIGGGRDQFRRESLEPLLGRVTLDSEPPGAELVLDGPNRMTLKTPVKDFWLLEGDYTVEACRAQYQRAAFTLQVRDQRETRHKIVLRDALRWQFRAYDAIHRAAQLADVNEDRVPDVLVASRDGRIYALSGRDGRALWTFDSKHPNPTDLVVAEGDVLFGAGGAGFFRLRASDGLPRYFVRTGNRTFVAAAPAGDVVAATWDGTISRWDGQALKQLRHERKWSVALNARVESIEQLDGERWRVRVEGGRHAVVADGGEIAWAEPPASAIAMSEEGLLAGPGWKFKPDLPIHGSPLEVDVDADGRPDVVFADDHRVYVLDGLSGTLRWHYEASGSIGAQAVTGDVTGDGIPEIIFGTNDGRVRAISVVSR